MGAEGVAVLGVDDQAIFLEVARDVVTATDGFSWVGGASSGPEAIDAVDALAPQLVLIDVRMPGMDGVETAHRICARHPEVVVILVSVDDVTAGDVEASGAAAFVHKRELGPAMLRRLWRTHQPA